MKKYVQNKKMKKHYSLNNKGFVATGVLYSLIGILALILFMTIANLATTKKITSGTAEDVKDGLAYYEIIYHANGGTGLMSNSYFSSGETTRLKPNAFAKIGHEFIGWGLTATSTSDLYPNNTLVNNQGSTEEGVNYLPVKTRGSITLYAHWNANSYTYDVVYKTSSGITLGTTDVTYEYGTTNTISPESFVGYTSPSSQSIVWDSTSSKTITFIYNPISYSITYNLNGGTNPSDALTNYTVETALTLPTPTRPGYTFGGWYTEASLTGSQVTSIENGTTGNKTYYAKWNAIFTSQGFAYTGNVQSFKVPATGTYKLEVWGAQGGYDVYSTPSVTVYGGKGGYSSGTISLTEGTNLYIAVGGKGKDCNYAFKVLAPESQGKTYAQVQPQTGGFNGGGNSQYDHAYWSHDEDGEDDPETREFGYEGGGGGGATHIAINNNRGVLSNYSSYRSEILIVAGGGGGARTGGGYDSGESFNANTSGGVGGGSTAGHSSFYRDFDDDNTASDVDLYDGWVGCGTDQPVASQTTGYAFGKGSYNAGGGWYGGQKCGSLHMGGGGSGYVGGVSGGTTIAGDKSMPTLNGASTMVGNSGNGYAKITLVQ